MNYNTKGEFMDRNLEKEEILKSMARLKKSYIRVYDYHRRLADQLWLKINDLDVQMQGLAEDFIAETNFGGEREEDRWTN